MSIVDSETIRELLRQAWWDSEPGTAAAHEEGGFVLRNHDGSLVVERWPRGTQNEIEVPPHAGGVRNGLPILATFHTHPHPEPDYQQESSSTDIRAVRDDPELIHPEYEGEYVIASERVYRIRKSGHVESVGLTSMVLT